MTSGEQVRNDVLSVLEEEVTVNVDGEEKKMPLIHTILRRGALEAAKGDYRWGKLMIDLRQQLIDNRTRISDEAIAEVFRTDAKFEEEAQANPEQEKEIRRRHAAFRSSPFVLQAFRQVRLPMPHSGKQTKAEVELARSIDLPDDNWFTEFDDIIK